MQIDVQKLQSLIEAASNQPPWCVYPPADPWGGGIGAQGTKYSIGGFESGHDDALAVAAVNALPALLTVYEAACACRDDGTQVAGARLWHRSCAAKRLCEAVDATRRIL